MDPMSQNESLSPTKEQSASPVSPSGGALTKPRQRDGFSDDVNHAVVPFPEGQHRRRFYLPVKGKFLVSTAFSIVWVCVSWLLAQHWLPEIENVVGHVPAVVIIFFIAILPGFLNAHILASVVLDRPPRPCPPDPSKGARQCAARPADARTYPHQCKRRYPG